ncbi:hypothetical protein FGB62_198g01 [Gracilaria domingensis]|nr:hypothetical protein FGB62_198g01 [Gracilaria domingensis]
MSKLLFCKWNTRVIRSVYGGIGDAEQNMVEIQMRPMQEIHRVRSALLPALRLMRNAQIFEPRGGKAQRRGLEGPHTALAAARVLQSGISPLPFPNPDRCVTDTMRTASMRNL